MGVSEIRPQMTIFFGTTPDKPIIIIYPFENRWNSLKHCWYRAVWGCALSCWRYLSWWQWCHCLRSQSRIVCWPSIEWRWIWNDLKWSGMIWNDVGWDGIGWMDEYILLLDDGCCECFWDSRLPFPVEHSFRSPHKLHVPSCSIFDLARVVND